jgi:hypothetical protein
MGDIPTGVLDKEIFISAATLTGYLDKTEETKLVWNEREEGLYLGEPDSRKQGWIKVVVEDDLI